MMTMMMMMMMMMKMKKPPISLVSYMKPRLIHEQPKLLPPPSYKYPQTICGYSIQEILRESSLFWDLSLVGIYEHIRGQYYLVGFSIHGLWESRLRYTSNYKLWPVYTPKVLHIRHFIDNDDLNSRRNYLEQLLSQIPAEIKSEMKISWKNEIHTAEADTLWLNQRALHAYPMSKYWEITMNLARDFVHADGKFNLLKILSDEGYEGVVSSKSLQMVLKDRSDHWMNIIFKTPRPQRGEGHLNLLYELRILHDEYFNRIDYPLESKDIEFVLKGIPQAGENEEDESDKSKSEVNDDQYKENTLFLEKFLKIFLEVVQVLFLVDPIDEGGRSKAGSRNDERLSVKQKKTKKVKDPNKPKRPPSAFFVFMEGFRKQFKEKNPASKGVAAMGKAGGDRWRSMSDEDKAEFVTIAEQRKKEYEKKMKAYENKQAGENEEDESDKSKSEVNDEDDEASEEEEDDD